MIADELLVRIMADTAPLKKAMVNIKTGLADVKEKTKRTGDVPKSIFGDKTDAIGTFSKKSADAFQSIADGMKAASSSIETDIDNISKHIEKVLSKPVKYWAFQPVTGKNFVDVEDTKQKLAEAEAEYEHYLELADETQALMADLYSWGGAQDTETATDYAEALFDFIKYESSAQKLKQIIEDLKISLQGTEWSNKNIQPVSDEMLELKRATYEAKEEYNSLYDKYMQNVLAGKDTGSDEMYQLSLAIVDAINRYTYLSARIKLVVNAQNELNNFTLWDRIKYDVTQVAQTFANLSSVLADKVTKSVTKFMSSCIKGFGTIVKSTAKLMVSLNPLPKLLSKVGDAFKRLFSRMREVLVYSTIISGFRSIKNTIFDYLDSNKQLQTQLNQLKGVWLTAFQPIYEIAVPALQKVIQLATQAGNAVATFMANITGKSLSTMKANAEALNAEANAVEAVGEEAKEAQKYLASFDELNVLSDNSSSSSTDETDLADFSKVENQTIDFSLVNLLDKCNALLPKFTKLMKQATNKLNKFAKEIKNTFANSSIRKKVQQFGKEFADSFDSILESIDWKTLGEGLGDGLELAIDFMYSFITNFNWQGLGTEIAEFINGAVSQIDWNKVGATLTESLNSLFDIISGFFYGVDWSQVGTALSDGLEGVFNALDGKKLGEALDSIMNGVVEGLAVFVKETNWSEVSYNFFNALSEALEGIDWDTLLANLGDLISGIITGIGQVIGGLLAAIFANDDVKNKIAEMGELGDEIDIVKAKIDSLTDSYNTNVSDIEAKYEVYDTLADKFFALSQKEELTDDELQLLNDTRKTLEDGLPGFADIIDDTSLSYDDQKTAVDELIASTENYYKTLASKDYLVEMYKEIINTKDAYAEATEEYNNYKGVLEDGWSLSEVISGEWQAATQARDNWIEAGAALREAQEDYQNVYEDIYGVRDATLDLSLATEKIDLSSCRDEFKDFAEQAAIDIDSVYGLWSDGKQLMGEEALSVYDEIMTTYGSLEEDAYELGNGTIIQLGKGFEDGEPDFESIIEEFSNTTPEMFRLYQENMEEETGVMMDGMNLRVKKGFEDIQTTMKAGGEDSVTYFKQGVQNRGDKVYQVAKDIFVDTPKKIITDALSDIKDKGKEIADNVVDGMTIGLEEGELPLLDTTSSVMFISPSTAIEKGWGIHSPSKVTEDYGKNIVEGMIQGIESLKTKLVSASETMMNAMKSVFTKDISEITALFQSNMVDTITAQGNQLASNANSFMSTFYHNIAVWINQISSAFYQLAVNIQRTMSSVKVNVPSQVTQYTGMSSFALSAPAPTGYTPVPLATGGVINSPTLGLMGEYAGASSNPEIVTPESKMREVFNEGNDAVVDTLVQITKQLIDAIENKDLNVTIGDQAIAKAAQRGNAVYKKLTGVSMFA